VSLSPTEPDPTLDMKTRAVDAMMERIKKGIVLRPSQRPQVGLDSACINQSINHQSTNQSINHAIYNCSGETSDILSSYFRSDQKMTVPGG
jgi:hypothetical protein